jgi:hypothetical protein
MREIVKRNTSSETTFRATSCWCPYCYPSSGPSKNGGLLAPLAHAATYVFGNLAQVQ